MFNDGSKKKKLKIFYLIENKFNMLVIKNIFFIMVNIKSEEFIILLDIKLMKYV